jgi:hypothetical protein
MRVVSFGRFLALSLVVFWSWPALAAMTVEQCAQLNSATASSEEKDECKQILSQIDQQILAQQRLVEAKQAERQSLERDVGLLEAEIRKSQLGIQARSIAIRELNDQIGDKEAVVSVLDDRSTKQKQSISTLLRKTQEIDDNSLAELVLSNKNFSEFFADFEDYRTVNNSLRESLQVLREIKLDTLDQKQSLEEKQEEEARQKQLQEAEKASIEVKEAEKSEILEVTKGQEAVYQAHLAQTQRTAAQLRAALFDLAGGGGRIPFTEAVQLAKFAGEKTGVSPAFILAILEQESEFGSNIGQCTYSEVRNGRAAMGPGSVPVFKVMAEVLGFDMETQRVSCPLSYGWGGAMGPSQFIPSTWALYGGYVNTGDDVYVYTPSQDSIRQLLGNDVPSSPFRNQDAFLATSLLMRDNGATAGSFDAEWTAAVRYYSGWSGVSNPRNHFYGDQVMDRKVRLEAEIRTLDAN